MTTANALSPPTFRVRAGAIAGRARVSSRPGVCPRVPTSRSSSGVPSRHFRNDNRASRVASSTSSTREASFSQDIDTNGVDLDDFESFVMELQRSICAHLERIDEEGFELRRATHGESFQEDDHEIVSSPGRFTRDAWRRDGRGSGFGITRVLEGGSVFEKAAANVSVIRGVLSKERAAAMSGRGRSEIDPNGGQAYAAAALSLVFHPRSPFVPTFRADIRRFQVNGVSWYGGGADLTPYYLFDQDAEEFHAFYRNLCNDHDPAFLGGEGGGGGETATETETKTPSGPLHARCKRWCDEYFYIPARKEHRGVGGIFFDDLSGSVSGSVSGTEPPEEATPRDAAAFVAAVGSGFIDSYERIVKRRWLMRYSRENSKWHHQRRGRYVEFNFLYDRGVKFGLDGGRVESVMVSAPPRVRWDYAVIPEPGSEEERVLDALRNPPRDW